LVRLELKAKYKASALGFAWSLLNPAMYLVVFYIAFDVILGGSIPRFPIYLLSGLLVWNFFTSALNTGTGSVVAGSGLVKTVWFPPVLDPFPELGRALHGHTIIALMNPVTPLVLTFQRALYGEFGNPPVMPPNLGFTWYLRNLAIVTVAVLVVLTIALRVFGRL